ncbi:amidohydrolase family protein [Stackebrandtia endophytica]|nr:amidohydrolase family protein [Stackebrandtia endophytica]
MRSSNDHSVGNLLIRNARIWTRPGAPISQPRDVWVRNGRIEAIESSLDPSEGVPELDVNGRVVTAGFWNCHVHLTEPVWRGTSIEARRRQQDALDDMLSSRGFSSVVDLASPPHTTSSLIHQIETGRLRGPGVVTAGVGILPQRGTPFYIKADVPWFLRWKLPKPATASGARRAVAAQVRGGAGVVKLFTGSYVTPDRVKPMRHDVARAAVTEAHRHGLRVFAHTSDKAGTEVAIEAGVDALAHVPDSAEGTVPLLEDAARRGIRVVPTLHMFAATVRTDDDYLQPLYESLRSFVGAGGRVLFGTDVGYMRDRDTRGEFQAMEHSGLSVDDILRSLTVEPAEFFGDETAGTVEVTNRADLTVLDCSTNSPAGSDLADVHATIRSGEVIWQRT